MAETVTFRKDLGIILVVSSGESSLLGTEGFLHAVTAIHKQHGLTRVLMDVRGLTSSPSTFQMFDFMSDLCVKVVPNEFRFAIVSAEHTREVMEFAETVAHNRGTTFRVFESVKEATKWLCE